MAAIFRTTFSSGTCMTLNFVNIMCQRWGQIHLINTNANILSIFHSNITMNQTQITKYTSAHGKLNTTSSRSNTKKI